MAGSVLILAYHHNFPTRSALSSNAVFEYFDPALPYVVSVKGDNGPYAKMSASTEMKLVVANALRFSAAAITGYVGERLLQVIQLSFDHDKGEVLIRVLVGGAPAAGETEAAIWFVMPDQSTAVANFTFIYYDDRVPTLAISPSAGSSAGGSVVFMTMSNFDVDGDLAADDLIVTFGEVTIALAHVLEVERSSPQETVLRIMTPSHPLQAGRLTVQVKVSSASQRYSPVALYEYAKADIRLSSVSPSRAALQGVTMIYITVENFNYDLHSITGIVFGSVAVSSSQVDVIKKSSQMSQLVFPAPKSDVAGEIECRVSTAASSSTFIFEYFVMEAPRVAAPLPSGACALDDSQKKQLVVQNFPPIAGVDNTHVTFYHRGSNFTSAVQAPLDISRSGNLSILTVSIPSLPPLGHVQVIIQHMSSRVFFSLEISACVKGASAMHIHPAIGLFGAQSRISLLIHDSPLFESTEKLSVSCGLGKGVVEEAVRNDESGDAVIRILTPTMTAIGHVECILAVGSSTVPFSLRVVEPCDWQRFCSTFGLVMNLDRIASDAHQGECNSPWIYCMHADQVPSATLISVNITRGPSTGGTVLLARFSGGYLYHVKLLSC